MSEDTGPTSPSPRPKRSSSNWTAGPRPRTTGTGDTLLQTARSAGLQAPYSCETGSCGTCMARITEGSARMVNNDALEDDEVAEGFVLTCQALPTSPTIRLTYDY